MTELLTLKPYHWTEEDIRNESLQIRMWALNRESERVLVTINGFKSALYIRLPRAVGGRALKWSKSKAKRFFNEIEYRVRDIRYEYEYQDYNKITMFTNNNPVPMIMVKFRSISDRRRFYYTLNKPQSYGPFKTQKLDILEQDISNVNRLTSITNIDYASWLTIEATLTPELKKISTLELEYVGRWKTLKQLGEESSDWVTYPPTMSIDIECHSNSRRGFPNSCNEKDSMYLISCVYEKMGLPETRKTIVILMGVCNSIDRFKDVEIILVGSEKEMVDVMFELFVEYGIILITGYNIFKFDIPYIYDRYVMSCDNFPHLSPLRNKQTLIKEKKWNSSAYGDVTIITFDAEGVIFFDLFSLISRDYKLRKNSLGFVSSEFLGDTKDDMPVKEMFRIFGEQQECLLLEDILSKLSNKVSDSKVKRLAKKFVKYINTSVKRVNVEKAMKSGRFTEKYTKKFAEMYKLSKDEMTRLVEYCIKDSILVIDLCVHLNCWETICSTASVSNVNPVSVYMSGQQVGTYSLLYRFAHENQIVIQKPPPPPDGSYGGGYVCTPIQGLHVQTVTLDFNSLYPSIMISHNLCYTTIVPPDKVRFISPDNYRVIDLGDEKVYVIKPEVFVGFIPKLLKSLLAARSNIRKPIPSILDAIDKAKASGMHDQVKLLLIKFAYRHSRQIAYKVRCNSVYGFTGTSEEMGIMPYKPIAKATTKIGRELITDVADYLEEKYTTEDVNCTVVYGDTDSVMVSIDCENPEDVMGIALDMEDDLNGIEPGGTDHRGVVYPDGVKGRFLPGLRIEVERLMDKIICIKPKYYSFIERKKGVIKQETITDSLGTRTRDVMFMKGVPPAKGGTPIFVSNIYRAICEALYNRRSYITCVKIMEKFINDLIDGKIPVEQLSKVAKIGGSYKNQNHELALFSASLSERGRPVIPGDKVEYIVAIKPGVSPTHKGEKMYMIEEMYEDDSLSPDVSYYISNTLKTVDSLINICFIDYVEERDDFVMRIGAKRPTLYRGVSQCFGILYNEGYSIDYFRKTLRKYNKTFNY